MLKDWKIKNGTMVHGGSNRVQLVGCSIELDPATNAYGFFGPVSKGHKLEATVPPDVNGQPAKAPFNFPRFKSKLNGTDSRDWYIQVDDLDNPIPDRVDGYWSNDGYPVIHEPGEVNPGESDTYTAQAGVGTGEDDMEPKAQTEPRIWTINVVGGGANKSDLLHCSIFRDASGDYQFRGPRGITRSTAFAPNSIPFNLPRFSAPLGGPYVREWFIRVTYVTENTMGGTWGNTQYDESHPVSTDGRGGGDSDTWTAQAGVGTEVGDNTEQETERTKEAAASASQKL